MSWVRHDDGTDEHPKVAVLSDRAFRLWYNGLCYCARQLTNGVIPLFQMPRLLAGSDSLDLVTELTTPQVADRAPLWKWLPDKLGVQVHDYLDYNPASSEVLGERYAAKERMRIVRQLRRLGVGDKISIEEWQTLPEELRAHYKEAAPGVLERQRGSSPVRPNVQTNVREQFGRSSGSPTRPDPTPSPKYEEPPVVPRERGTSEPVEVGGRVARWASGAKRPRGLMPKTLEAAVVRCLRELRQSEVSPDRCSTAAASVLSLWRALDRPDVHRFADDLTLVARAAQMSGDKLFARDVRAEGWSEGTDRMLHVATICRHDKWDDRLRAAQLWGKLSGRVCDDGVARAKRGRWFDPYDMGSWKLHPEPVPMIGLYIECARRLLQDELGGDDLRSSLGRLEALVNLKGSCEEVTAVVRFALDEVGKW